MSLSTSGVSVSAYIRGPALRRQGSAGLPVYGLGYIDCSRGRGSRGLAGLAGIAGILRMHPRAAARLPVYILGYIDCSRAPVDEEGDIYIWGGWR